MSSSAPTAPARRVGPCMHDASSCTTPSSLGKPPSPTDWSSGSSSVMLTPAMMASSVSAFWRVIMSYAFATPRMPLAEEITIGGPANPPPLSNRSSVSALASRSRVRPAAAAALKPTKWRREIDKPLPSVNWLTQLPTAQLVADSGMLIADRSLLTGQISSHKGQQNAFPLTL